MSSLVGYIWAHQSRISAVGARGASSRCRGGLVARAIGAVNLVCEGTHGGFGTACQTVTLGVRPVEPHLAKFVPGNPVKLGVLFVRIGLELHLATVELYLGGDPSLKWLIRLALLPWWCTGLHRLHGVRARACRRTTCMKQMASIVVNIELLDSVKVITQGVIR